MTEKKCSLCGRVLPLADFNRHRRQRDGYQPQCRSCSKAGKVRWRQENRSRVRLYERHRRPQRKSEARRLARQAEVRGELIRPGACTGCGRVGPVEGHHKDYDRPLDIVWVCRLCHEAEHRNTRLGPRTITRLENKKTQAKEQAIEDD